MTTIVVAITVPLAVLLLAAGLFYMWRHGKEPDKNVTSNAEEKGAVPPSNWPADDAKPDNNVTSNAEEKGATSNVEEADWPADNAKSQL